MHQPNLPLISFQPDAFQVCNVRHQDLWKIGDSPLHEACAKNLYRAFFSWIADPPAVLWLENGLPKVPALIATEYLFHVKISSKTTSGIAYYLCHRNKGYINILGSLLYQLVQQLPSTDISPLLLCYVLNTRNISVIEFLCVRACGEFKKTYIILDAIDAYHDSPDILADILEMIGRLSNTTSVLFTTTHSDASIRTKFLDIRRLDASPLVLQMDACTSDTTVQASPDLVEEILLSLTNPLYHNYARFFRLEPNPVPYLQRTAYKWQKRKLFEMLDRGPPEQANSTSDSELLRDIQIALLGNGHSDHIFRKFLVSSTSWRNIIPLASKDPLMTVNFLQREIDTRAYVYNEAYYRARCIKCLLKVAETYLVIPTCLVISNIRCDAKRPICGGGYADIYQGRINNSDVCLKVLRIFTDGHTKPREDVRKEFCREVLVWRNLNHPNVLPFIGINDDLFYPSFCLISPWMNDGNLISFLATHPEHNRMQCIMEVANGLHYLHSHEPQVIHADIRGANIIVTSDHHCCLADFGLAKAVMTCGPGSYGDSTKGSVRWLAPELLRFDASSNWHYMASRDIYAFGCTMVEVFTGRVPFSDIILDVSVIFAVLQNDRRPTRPSHVELPYDGIWSLMELCWSKDVHRRPSSSNLVTMLNNLDVSKKPAKREKLAVKTVKTMVLSRYNLQNQQKLGIGRHFHCHVKGCSRSFISSSVRRKHMVKCQKEAERAGSVP